MDSEGVNKKEVEVVGACDCNWKALFTVKLADVPVQIGLFIKFPSKKDSFTCPKQKIGSNIIKNKPKFFIDCSFSIKMNYFCWNFRKPNRSLCDEITWLSDRLWHKYINNFAISLTLQLLFQIKKQNKLNYFKPTILQPFMAGIVLFISQWE